MPQPDITIEMDTSLRQFQSALVKFLEVTKSELSDVLNRKLYFVARKAFRLIKKADRIRIENELRVERQFFGKRGKRLKRAKLIRATGAESIIQGGRINRGEKPLPKAELEAAAKKMVGSRLRAIGSVRAGMLGIIQSLGRKLRLSGRMSEKSPRIKRRGQARPARPQWDPTATGIYRVTINQGGKRIIPPDVKSAVAKALSSEAFDMESEFLKRTRKNWNRL